MIYHLPYSYEQELKEQVAERLGAIERIHRAGAFDQGRPIVLANLVGSLGKLLVRLGTRLEQPSRIAAHINGRGAEQRG
jgi:hypothetical protein